MRTGPSLPVQLFCAIAFAGLLSACSGGATVGAGSSVPTTASPQATPSPSLSGAMPTASPSMSAAPAGSPPASASPGPGASMSPSIAPSSPASIAPSSMPTQATAAPATPLPSATPTTVAQNANGLPQLRHVFIIILENQAEDNTFGSLMPVPYLQKTVSAQGAFLPNYYGTSHASLGNYLSLFSGQSVTTLNQNDCPTYTQILNGTVTGMYGQVAGMGCVYPATVPTISDQLAGANFSAKGYMEDMGNDPTREGATCGQTEPTAATGVFNAGDMTSMAQAGNALKPRDQYAMRHNPWPYFMSVINSGACAREVRPLSDQTLTNDLRSIATTANYTFVTPNLCNDGHDVPCAAPGDAGDTAATYDNENAFLAKWVPVITRSPAFLQDGLLIITFDESSPAKNGQVGTDMTTDSMSCCQEKIEVDPNTATPGGSTGSDGSGGGRTGTVLVSPFIAPGTVSANYYNHYNVLHTVEDEFGLSYLGFAGFPGTVPFGADIFGTTPVRHTIAL